MPVTSPGVQETIQSTMRSTARTVGEDGRMGETPDVSVRDALDGQPKLSLKFPRSTRSTS